MGTFAGKCVHLHCKHQAMSIFSIHKKVEETLYLPVGPMPWPVKDDHIWLVTGAMAPDCLALTYDLIPGLAMRGYQLQSFPLVLGQLSAAGLNYNFPGLDLGLGEINEIEFRKAVENAIGLEINPTAGYFIRKASEGDGFLVAEIVARHYNSFLLKAQPYINILPEHKDEENVRFSKLFRDGDTIWDLLDDDYDGRLIPGDDDVSQLAHEVKRKIEALVMQDFPIEVIENWLKKAIKLSHIKITADYRILLTDYGKEIKMRQLPKALFLFFLKHPEGCRLKDLCDHKAEILEIYRKLTIHEDPSQTEASIDALVNAHGNSFSEKCSAIKLAFLNEISDRIAQNYYIFGPQGGVKGISLDRSLVEWEE